MVINMDDLISKYFVCLFVGEQKLMLLIGAVEDVDGSFCCNKTWCQ